MERKAVIRTAVRLRELLADRPEYANLWRVQVDRQQSGAIHQSGVCHVIAHYLWDNGLHSDTDTDLPRKLKDRVYRALAGQSLSRATLRWFIEAFEMSPADAAELLRLSTPSGAGNTVLGGLTLHPGTLPPRRHSTVSLHEWHNVGPDGLPDSHRTVHVIRADEPMDRYPYIFDTDAASVQVVRGGRAGQPYALDHNLFAVDIELSQPLRAGDTSSFEYITRFWYRTPPAQEFRRASTARVENVDLRVQFHPLRLPSKVWWSVWPALDAEPDLSQEVALDADKGVHRYLSSIEATIVGFRWNIPVK
ncbi:MAG: hypothetical protein WAS07_07915 [Micropruina sp.]